MTAARQATATAVMAAVIAVFVARPLLAGRTAGVPGVPGVPGVLVLFGVLALLGAIWPLPAVPPRSRRAALVALVAGVAAFGLGRLLGGHTPTPQRAGYLAAVVFAALAEELFFRRFVYAVLRPGGAAVAVGGSAALFALAHVTVYGWWVLPLDLAAGLVLGWQRWASGTWAVPAATHVVANLLIVL